MNWMKILEAGIGVYLLLPGAEDVASGGLTLGPSSIVGGALVAHAFGAKLPW